MHTKRSCHKYKFPGTITKLIIELRTQKGHLSSPLYISRKPNTKLSKHGNIQAAGMQQQYGHNRTIRKANPIKMPLPMSLTPLPAQKQQAIIIVLCKH
jgi:hypothetical protein